MRATEGSAAGASEGGWLANRQAGKRTDRQTDETVAHIRTKTMQDRCFVTSSGRGGGSRLFRRRGALEHRRGLGRGRHPRVQRVKLAGGKAREGRAGQGGYRRTRKRKQSSTMQGEVKFVTATAKANPTQLNNPISQQTPSRSSRSVSARGRAGAMARARIHSTVPVARRAARRCGGGAPRAPCSRATSSARPPQTQRRAATQSIAERCKAAQRGAAQRETRDERRAASGKRQRGEARRGEGGRWGGAWQAKRQTKITTSIRPVSKTGRVAVCRGDTRKPRQNRTNTMKGADAEEWRATEARAADARRTYVEVRLPVARREDRVGAGRAPHVHVRAHAALPRRSSRQRVQNQQRRFLIALDHRRVLRRRRLAFAFAVIFVILVCGVCLDFPSKQGSKPSAG